MYLLPTELLHCIFSLLGKEQKSLSRISRVCRKWHAIALPILFHRPQLTNKRNFHTFLQIPTSSGILVHEIDLSGFSDRRTDITDDDIIALVNLCPNLTFLDINYCRQLHDLTLTHIANHLGSNLTTLNVSSCPKFTDVGFSALARSCKVLASLDFSYTDITDTALSKFAVTCPTIKWLNLKYCELVTDLSLDELKRMCKELRFLELEGCYGVMREVGEGDFGQGGIRSGITS
ncbi:3413_t:CDS:2 [Funneliformis geosporum]|uniref:10757_t:CDS:1 n=1 Tax=Funneliformis geosporum TaxID=1117311 RepID=A0A9W4WZ11_9GLOM|nr:10757_t:CDS:2 [Funneliformis geosporum]CAI2184927.1 3413_t:CDS:2 [Funneliformis geosporum]